MVSDSPDKNGYVGTSESLAESNLVRSDETQLTTELVARDCVLIRNALTFAEQSRLCEYIEQSDRTPKDQPRAMVPTPKTLLLGEDAEGMPTPQIRYAFGDDTVINAMVDKSVSILKEQKLNVFCSSSSELLETHGRQNPLETHDVCQYNSLVMATIRYEAPNGCFPPHVDHCNDSFVCLASLGRTANFMVKGPGPLDTQRHFPFNSGGVLLFDASSRASVLHSVVSIEKSASKVGEALANKFPVLNQHRYGVQCRMFF